MLQLSQDKKNDEKANFFGLLILPLFWPIAKYKFYPVLVEVVAIVAGNVYPIDQLTQWTSFNDATAELPQ